MAELEENLGQLSSTLDRLVNEVAGLRTELADLKKINTSVLKKQLVRKGAEKEIHYLWWDKKQGQTNHEDVFTWPSSNCSSTPNHVFQNSAYKFEPLGVVSRVDAGYHRGMLFIYNSQEWLRAPLCR